MTATKTGTLCVANKTCYRNGVPVGVTSEGADPPSSHFYIGGILSNDGSVPGYPSCQGAIQVVYVYNTEITAPQVSALNDAVNLL
jgi:hypothetical protein